MLPSPSLLHQLYHGTLQSRLDFCKALHARLSHRLMQDPTFSCTFATLRQAADTLAGYMAARGLGRQCAACATDNPGGCCSREMAEETDALQMLMNLLAGVKVEISDGQGKACCFIGTEGCSFMFKPMFCLNYNCTRIIARIGPARSELESLTGRLLGIQYEVEKLLLAGMK